MGARGLARIYSSGENVLLFFFVCCKIIKLLFWSVKDLPFQNGLSLNIASGLQNNQKSTVRVQTIFFLICWFCFPFYSWTSGYSSRTLSCELIQTVLFPLQPGTCGWGTRKRKLVCQDSRGKVFDDSHCTDISIPHEQVSDQFQTFNSEQISVWWHTPIMSVFLLLLMQCSSYCQWIFSFEAPDLCI